MSIVATMNDDAHAYDSRNVSVLRVGPEFAAEALAIVREAAAWARGQGIEVWSDAELSDQDFHEEARLGQLVMGFSDRQAAAAMLLQPSDPLYWPTIAPNTSLYLHKIAVRRAFAGCGWPARLIEFAANAAAERGLRWLRLDTLFRPALQALYERHGFKVVDEPPLLVRGRRMIRMQRALCR